MPRDTTVIPFRQPEATEDSLTEVAREGARRMLAQVLIAEADTFVAMWKDLKLPDGRDRVVRHGHGPHRAKSRWSRSCATRIAEPVAPGTIVRQVLVMCRHLECLQPRCQRRLRLTFFSLLWRSMAE